MKTRSTRYNLTGVIIMVGGTLPMAGMRYPICLADQLHMRQIHVCAYYSILVFDHLCKNSHCLDNCFHSSQVMIVFHITYTYIRYVHLQGLFFHYFILRRKHQLSHMEYPIFRITTPTVFQVKIFCTIMQDDMYL